MDSGLAWKLKAAEKSSTAEEEKAVISSPFQTKE
jgi:hypothetical protein